MVRAEILRKWAMMEIVSTDALHQTSHSDLFSRTIAVLAEAQSKGRITAEESGSAQAKTYQVWAQGLARAGNIDEARKLLDKAIDLDENNAAVAHAQGQIEETLDNFPAAIAAYRRGLEANPNDAYLLQSWGRIEAKMGRLDNARKLFRHGVETNEENYHIPQAWAVSEAEHPEGDAATAREMFQRASSLAYWSVQTWAAWARFELDAEDNEQRLETARTLYERGLDAEPGNLVCLVGLAKCESRLGRFGAARETLRRANAIHPDSSALCFAQARLEEAAGAPAKAAHLYQKARQLQKESRKKKSRVSTRGRGSRSTWDPVEAFERQEIASASIIYATTDDNHFAHMDEQDANGFSEDEKRRSSDDLGSYEPPRSYERRRVRKTRRAPSTRVAPRAADDDDVLGSSLDSL